MKVKEYVAPGQYNHVEIPSGSWAVIINEQEDTTNRKDEYSHMYPSLDTDVSFVGPRPNRIVLGETRGKSCINSRVLYWHEQPFAVIEWWESPMHGQWVHLASEVNEHGLTKRLPVFTEPSYISSRAGSFGPEEKAGKWTRLTDLATLIGITPADLLVRHGHHFDGYESGLALIKAATGEAVAAMDEYGTSSLGGLKEHLASDLSMVWVRKRFVLVALYLHMLGYSNR